MALKDEMDAAIYNLRECILAQNKAIDLVEEICNEHFGVKVTLPRGNTKAIDGALKTIEQAAQGTQ